MGSRYGFGARAVPKPRQEFSKKFPKDVQSQLSPLEVNHLYQFCRFRFDPENHSLESEGNPISLTPKAFEILLVLVQNGTRLTTKEELMRKVWPDSFAEEANLTVNISALRRHLGETPGGQQYIETVPKKGYRFAVPVSQLRVNDDATFLREGDDLRIACQLIDVKTENLLWKGAFDLKYDKLLTVQDQVAQQIIRGLEVTLSASEAGRLKTDEAVSPLAYEYYLRGVDLYSKGDFPMAIKMLAKSTQLGQQFALAWAHLGRSYTANASFQLGGAEQYHKAEAAFAKALSLQPDEIDARIYLANMYTDTGRVEKAVPLLREAFKTNPNHAEIHWELGYAHRFAGMLFESVSECERARQLDPGVKLNSSTPNGYLYLGRYDQFLQSLPKTEDVALIVFYRGLGE
jgi:DNA-binding winged helix-turn-helix (wHTH) protein